MKRLVRHPGARPQDDGGERRAPARAGQPAGGWRRRPRAGDDPWELLYREVDRSRRHRHELVLVRLAPPARRRGERRVLELAASALRPAIRSVDVLWIADDAIFVLLPETDRAAAEGLLRRLEDRVAKVAPDGARLACFPQDGLTANALRAAVARSMPGPTALPTRAPQAMVREHEREERDVAAPHEASG
jgi:hypothetical protein